MNFTSYRQDRTITNVPTLITPAGPASAHEVFMINVINNDSAAIFLKFWDKKAASEVTIGTTAPVRPTLQIPANGQACLVGEDGTFAFDNGIVIAVVTTSINSGTTAPGTLPLIEIDYR